jgi:Fe-S-cluster containining protein
MLKYVPPLSDFDEGNGVCRYLRDNLCDIYENRPLICNAEAMYLKYFKDIMSEEEFISANQEACRKIADIIESDRTAFTL